MDDGMSGIVPKPPPATVSAVELADDAPQLSGTAEQLVEVLRGYEAVGVERAMLQHLVHEDVEMVAVLGELAAALC